MKKRSHHLQQVSLDQAAVLQLSTLAGFAALGYNPDTLRQWSADGHIHPVGKAPGGAFLFHIPTVIAAHRWHETRAAGRTTESAEHAPTI